LRRGTTTSLVPRITRGAPDLKPETLNPNPEPRNPQPGTRCLDIAVEGVILICVSFLQIIDAAVGFGVKKWIHPGEFVIT
jgi:hypothetical protein